MNTFQLKIKEALDNAYQEANEVIEKSRGILHRKLVKNVLPANFPAFMDEHNIPKTAEIVAENYDIYFQWIESVARDEKGIQNTIKNKFNTLAYFHVERVLSETHKLKRYWPNKSDFFNYLDAVKMNEIFDLYDLYNNNDWRNLEIYFHYLYKSL
jgi:hypothetical protein